jgi:hypothetical protein
MPPKKKLTDEEKKLEQYRKDVITAMTKLRNGRLVVYDKGIRARTMNMNNEEFQDFKQNLEISLDLGDTPEEAAKKLSAQALRLKIIEPHVTQLIRAEEKAAKVEAEKKVTLLADESATKREPIPVVDPPDRPLIDEKKEQKQEVILSDEQKAFLVKRAKGQKAYRQRVKENSVEEMENLIKQTEERVRKEEREIADKKIETLMKELEQSKVDRVEPKKSEKKKVSRTIETVLNSAPSVARLVGSMLAPSGMGAQVGKLAESAVSMGVPIIADLFRSEKEERDEPAIKEEKNEKEKEEKDSKEEVIEIGASGFTPQAIPPGLKRFMRNIGTYTSIYNRLSPEQKQSISPIDQGMLVLKQALTRTPVTSAASKTYHSAVGKILDKMNREMKTPADIKNNIQELGTILSDPPEEIRNVIGPIDNALGVGYGQVIEMKRTGNVLQPLVETAGNQILRLEPQQIAEAFNSIMRNATEAELGGQERVEPRERKIPQVGLEQARQLREIVRSEKKETTSNSDPLFAGEPETKRNEKRETKRGLEYTPEIPDFIRNDILNPQSITPPGSINSTPLDIKTVILSTPEARSLFVPGGMRLPPLRPISSNQGFLSPEERKKIQDAKFELSERKRARDRKREEISKQQPYEGVATDPSGIASDIKKTIGVVTGAAAGVPGLVYDTAKNIYNNIMETPITMPVETQAQSDQKISSATGTMRPRFIVPGRDSVIPSMPKIRADDIQFSAFDYVIPGSEGGNGTARSNPLVLSQELEERLRYSNAGITISPGFGENVVNMILTESELKALLLPRGPDVSPVIYEFPIIDGDQAQNEVKRYDQNLIQVEKFSPYNEYNDNEQLDEEVFGSILLSYVP